MVKTLLGKEREAVIEKLEDIADYVGLMPSDKKRYDHSSRKPMTSVVG